MKLFDILLEFLYRTLYRVPNTSEAQAEAIRTWNKGKGTLFDYEFEENYYFYLFVYETLLTILENILGAYANENELFTPVAESLTVEYEYILVLLRLLFARSGVPQFKKPTFAFDEFKSLRGDPVRLIHQWQKQKGTLYDYRGDIATYCQFHGKKTTIPYLLQRLTDEAKMFSEQYKETILNKKEVNENQLSEVAKRVDSENAYRCCGLVLNLPLGTIHYNDNLKLDISPDVHIIKFLALLLHANGIIIEYIEIAKELGINSYHAGVTNKDVVLRKDVQYKKQEVVEFLVQEVKMPKEKVDKMILHVNKKGYKTSCG